METIIVQHNQSLFDIANKATGNPLNALLIAAVNEGINPSDDLEVGTEILIPDGLEYDDDLKDYYTRNNYIPATGLTAAQAEEVQGCEGIGCWAIDIDFIVS